jgi:hypothetical protein
MPCGYHTCRCGGGFHLIGAPECKHSGKKQYRVRVWHAGHCDLVMRRTKWTAARLLADVMRRHPNATRIDVDPDTWRPYGEDATRGGVCWIAAAPSAG